MIRTRTLLAVSAAVLSASPALSPAFAAQQADWSLFGGKSDAKPDAKETEFVAPLTSPYFHEDSFITNDVRAWYVYHKFDGQIELAGGGKVNQGGDAQVVAVQGRLALTDRLQLVAYKDGYVVTNGNVLQQEGWNDLAAGLKYAFLQDRENQLFAAAGVGYQFAVGDDEVLQKKNEARAWASVNKGFDALHLGATTNLRVAGDRSGGSLADTGGSTVFSLHAHADYRVTDLFSPVAELNAFQVLDDGARGPLDTNVGDVTNVAGGKHEFLATGALGFEYRCPLTGLKVRSAYEIPLTNNNDVFQYRVTTSVVYAF